MERLNRKIWVFAAMTLLLIGMLTLAFNIQPVKASGTIYIRADGSIDPPDAPIITYDNVTYTLIDNITSTADGIVVERDNIIINGAGYTLQGTGADESKGIALSGRTNVTVRNTQIKNFDNGVWLNSSSNNSISGNNIANNDDGVVLHYSSNNIISGNNVIANIGVGVVLGYSSNNNSISGNNIANNCYGVNLDSSSNNSISGNTFTNDGLYVWDSYHNVVVDNTMNGKPLVYLEGVANYGVSDAGQVILVNCDGIRVKNLNLYRTSIGVELWKTNNSVISGNNIANNIWGVVLHSSYSNIISGNNIINNIAAGVFLTGSSNNNVSENNITNNKRGLWFFASYNNRFYHNNFIDNSKQVFDTTGSMNVWDDGYPSGGNYWSDYTGADEKSGPNQDQPGRDGIVDTPYIIDANNRDRYPLMTGLVDSDGDGIWDQWETDGIDWNRDGTIDLILPGADPNYKDLYLEIDYMGFDGTHDHEPDPNAISDVINAFRNAPVNNPNGTQGIALHIEVDESIPHQDVINVWDDFNTIKSNHFGTAAQRGDPNSVNILAAKRLVYRYCLFIHQFAYWNGTHWVTKTNSGIAELPGNDFIVSLGEWFDRWGTATRDEQAGTLMHELGHTLGLRHGGGDDINGKPNYLSVMSYSRQFPDFIPNRPLDYSRARLPSLNESNLDENLGIQGPAGGQTVHGPLFFNFTSGKWEGYRVSSQGPIDWNRNGKIEGNVAVSINDFRPWFGDDKLSVLEGYDDWANLQYNFRYTPEFADGVHVNVADQEITWEIAQQMRNATIIGFHDVAITEATSSKTVVGQGYSMNINVTVQNQGDYPETFNVTLYANTTEIETREITLTSLNSTTLTFIWNTTGFVKGNYTLWAYAEPVPGETDTTDNLYVDGTVQIIPIYNVTIKAHCNTEGVDVAVSITMDGSPTGYNTPHTFTGLIGSHTFTVPNMDPSGHPFKQWNTGETSTTITVTSGGTYTAYYETPPPPPPPGVGGYVIPVDKFSLLAPYIGLASFSTVAAVATAVYVKRVKRRKEKQ